MHETEPRRGSRRGCPPGVVAIAGVLLAVATGAGAVCIEPPDGLIAWYKGDLCTPEDFLLRHPGEYVGITACPMASKVGGGALGFSDDAYVDVVDDPALDPAGGELSLDAWLLTTAGGTQPIAEKRAGTGYGLSLHEGRVRFEVCDATACHAVEGTTSVNDGGWHLIAATLDRVVGADQISVYVDGAVDGTLSVASLGVVTAVSPLRIGASPSVGLPLARLDGVLDEIEIFDRALTAAEVSSLFAADGDGKCPDLCVGPPAGMRAWWSLDETTGIIAGERIDDHDGVHVGCPTPVEGKVDAAIEFSGVERVEVPDADALDVGTDDFSLDAWVRTTSDDLMTIVDKRGVFGAGLGYHLYLAGGRVELELGDAFGVEAAAGDSSVADGDWHHVAVTVDRDSASGIRFYVDGAPDGTADPTSVAGTLTNDVDLWIGMHPLLGIGFQGAIDEVELFDRVLSPFEVERLHGAGSKGKCKAMPTEGVGLVVSPLHLGQTSTLAAGGARAGETVHFARGTGAGCGPCVPVFGGLCVDLLSPVSLGTAVADATGTAELSIAVPPSAPLVDVWIQAVIGRGDGGRDSVKSTVHRETLSR